MLLKMLTIMDDPLVSPSFYTIGKRNGLSLKILYRSLFCIYVEILVPMSF